MILTARSRLAYLGALACLGLYAAMSATSQRVTTYAAICLVPVTNGTCTSPGRTLDSASFTVSIQQQAVWVSESSGSFALEECAVTSTHDWRCTSPDGVSQLGITAGQPWLVHPGRAPSDIFFVSRWRYLWMKAGEPRAAGPLRPIFR